MKKSHFFSFLFLVLCSVSGLGCAYFSNYYLYESDNNFLNVPIEFKDTYLGPTDKRWAKYVDNPLPTVIHHGSKDFNKIALTFDDGPRPESTVALLEILKRFNVKATFFIVGAQAEKYPELVQRIYDEGHEIGNHTYSHTRLTKMTREELIEDIEKTRTIIFNQTGFIPYLFRPPGGKFNAEVLGIIKELNYSTVLWTTNSGDWKYMNKDILTNRVISDSGPGNIVLMHNSISSSTIDALPQIIEQLQAKHYELVTISNLYM